MKKIFIYTTVILLWAVTLKAQQDPQYSHYMFSNVANNPGAAGMDGLISANLISHDQWIGWDGAPKTRLLSVDAPFNLFNIDQGAALTICDDRLGFEKNFNAKLAYSFHKAIGAGKLGIGVDLGILNKAIDTDSLKYPDGTDENVFGDSPNKTAFDIGAGAFFIYENLYTGLSMTHINRPTLVYGASGKYKLKSHYSLTAGYNMLLSNTLIEMVPSFLIKTDITTAQFDINLLFKYNKKTWAGVSYRNKDAVVLFAGTSIINNVKIGLAYDITISKMQSGSNGTIEVYVGYSFYFERTPKVQQYRSVRFL